MAKKKIAALLIAAVVAAGGWALPARVSAAEERYFGKRDAGCYDSR